MKKIKYFINLVLVCSLATYKHYLLAMFIRRILIFEKTNNEHIVYIIYE